MRLKSYFADTLEVALEEGRRELGWDALFLEAGQSSDQSVSGYRAVFAVDPEPAQPAGTPDEPDTPEKSGEREVEHAPAPHCRSLECEIAELRRQLSRMTSTMTAFDSLIMVGLTSNEVAPDLARAIARCLDDRIESDGVANARKVVGEVRCSEGVFHPVPDSPANSRRVRQALIEELGDRFQVCPEAGKPGGERQIMAVVGPPGVGKTTTLAKLAVTLGLTRKRPTMLVAPEGGFAKPRELRTFAGIFGTAFSAPRTAGELSEVLEHWTQGLVLIDTPGFGPGDLGQSSQWAELLASRDDIDIHLAVACTMKAADIARTIDQYAAFVPSKLLFTKLDETEFYGTILNEAVRTGWPVSFLTCGREIPEDLEPATKDRIINLVLGRG